MHPSRTMSHFVELNDLNGEDMLLEDIDDGGDLAGNDRDK